MCPECLSPDWACTCPCPCDGCQPEAPAVPLDGPGYIGPLLVRGAIGRGVVDAAEAYRARLARLLVEPAPED